MNWAPSPEIFSAPLTIPILDLKIALRWYSVMFMFCFASGYFILRRLFRKEGWPNDIADGLLMAVILGTVIGARLGHCLFYQPDYYLTHPWEIPMVWKGGLASHGGAIGIFIAVFWFAKRDGRKSFWQLIDRVALVVPLSGMFVRIGNFFNSEILGKPTDVPWAVTFSQIDSMPRHPAQLYEALCYLVIFFIEWAYYQKRKAQTYPGSLLGLTLILIFSVRFVIEFVKEDQVAFEAGLPLNMGQLLSLPVIAVGFWLLKTSRSRAEAEPGSARPHKSKKKK